MLPQMMMTKRNLKHPRLSGSSAEEEAGSRKVEEQNETKTATTEVAESVMVENVKGDDISVVDDKKERNSDTKVEEI